MHKLLLALFIITAISADAQTTHPAGVTGCIVHYDFNTPATSTLPDVSGNNHDAFAFNLSSSTGFRNRVGNAWHFNGINAGARARPDTQFDVSKLTIVALVRFNDFYSGTCQGNMIVGRTSNYYTPGSWALDITDHNYDQNCVSYSPDFEQVNFVTSSLSAPPPPLGNYLSTGAWYLLVVSYDGSIASVYQTKMDTASRLSSIAPINTLNYNVALGSNNDSLYVGWLSHPSFPYWVNGDMDDIAIFNKALSPAEVKAIYDYHWGMGLSVGGDRKIDDVAVFMSDNKLQISNPMPGTAIKASVYDMAGRSVGSIVVPQGLSIMNLSEYASGIFMVRLELAGTVLIKKVSKL